MWQTNNNQDNKGLSTDCDHEYRSSQAGGGWVNLYILSKHSLSWKLFFLRYGTQEHALETPKDVFLFGRGGPPFSKTICFPPILDWASIMLRWPREHVLHIKSGWWSCPESSGARLDFVGDWNDDANDEGDYDFFYGDLDDNDDDDNMKGKWPGEVCKHIGGRPGMPNCAWSCHWKVTSLLHHHPNHHHHRHHHFHLHHHPNITFILVFITTNIITDFNP